MGDSAERKQNSEVEAHVWISRNFDPTGKDVGGNE